MKRAATQLIVLMVVLVASVALTTPSAAALRAPQVSVLGGTLQTYLNSIGESINVLTSQDATQLWAHTTSATTGFTLMIENSPGASATSVSMYNGSGPANPARYLLLPNSFTPQYFALATFKPGNLLTVNRFNDLGILISSITYSGVDPTGFGFVLDGPGTSSYTQDSRNPGGRVQAVAFAGTGANAGAWWLCFEESPVAAGSDQDFDDCVIVMESVNPSPVNSTTWGQLKARFR